MTDKNDICRVGDFLVQNELITNEQLGEALALQKDNPERLVGEILVTLGILTKEEMIMALEMYAMTTDAEFGYIDEWLDQEEVDLLMNKISNSKNN